jgi:hypothetical protein
LGWTHNPAKNDKENEAAEGDCDRECNQQTNNSEGPFQPAGPFGLGGNRHRILTARAWRLHADLVGSGAQMLTAIGAGEFESRHLVVMCSVECAAPQMDFGLSAMGQAATDLAVPPSRSP